MFTREELNRNSGKPCYILEFYTAKKQYSYKVDAKDGSIRICGFTTHSGSLTLPFFRLSRNALDFSISAFMAAMVSVLGAGTVFVTSPYRTCHVTADAS